MDGGRPAGPDAKRSGAPGRCANGPLSVPWGRVWYTVRMTRTVQRAHKLRLYPTADQRRRLDVYFGAARWVWNRAVSRSHP